jgi:hypothetical protein
LIVGGNAAGVLVQAAPSPLLLMKTNGQITLQSVFELMSGNTATSPSATCEVNICND